MTRRAPVVAMQDAVAALFSVPVAVGHADPCAAQPPLWPAEAAAMATARTARRREFAAGRSAARAALAALGHPPTAIPMGPDRAPCWPHGVLGTITHTADCALAVASRAPGLRGLGLDMEPAAPLDSDLWPEIATRSEWRWLESHPPPDRSIRARALFCAKEAAFKAQYPATRALFGFDALELTVQPDGRFEARPARTVPGLAAGTVIRGQLWIGQRHILAAAELPA